MCRLGRCGVMFDGLDRVNAHKKITPHKARHPSDMSAIAKSTVSIRFFGEDLDPAEITRTLGREPSTHYRKGDKRTSAGREYERKCGAWIAAAEDKTPEAINDQLDDLFANMSQDMQSWLTLSSKYDADVFCGLFMDETNEGFSLRPATLQALASRGLEIDFDVYRPTENEGIATHRDGEA
jgi:hypothetical protein